tara:strand:+ start:3553 stop:5697 length:2145 start_codon:yes stop_codon:yes gene_type:complete
MSFLNEGKANTHLTHLEELVLTQGAAGYDMARAFLLELLETLKGNSKSHVQTSVKWDGAPAIFAGINPENGKFFVGTKSIFNKVPKINYTPQDIIDNHGHAPGLVDKLTKALKYLPSLGIQNILQGDFMFDDEMLDVINVDGEPHYRFKPNTLVYAVPVDSDLGKKIGRSKFGIVFHTTYDSLDSGASFGADVSGLNKVPGIWFDDAFFTDDTGTVTLTENEERRVVSLVNKADEVNHIIDYNDLPSAMLNIYINSEIRQGQFLEDPEESFQGFLKWYQLAVAKDIEKVKRDETKERKRIAGEEKLQSFENNKKNFLNLFKVSRLLFEAKNVFIAKYNNAVYNTKHFVEDGSGDLVATNPEGYVAVDHAGNGIKFVDRLEFSRANFMIDKSSKFQQSENLIVYWETNGFSTKKTLQEWAANLPRPSKTNKNLFKQLQAGVPITSLISDARMVKYSLAEAVHWALNEQDGKKPIAIYPGRFQPMGRHHFQTFQRLVQQFGLENTFIATSDASGPKSPLNFEEKKTIMMALGIPESQIVKTRSPYQPTEITNMFDPAATSVVFAVGKKDMKDNPRFANLDGVTKGGTPAYYKTYYQDQELEGLDRHGYMMVAPHVELNVPGYGEMSGTTLRQALKGADPEEFETLMGFFDQEAYDILQGKLEEMSAMGGGAVAGYAGRAPEVAGSEKKKKRHPKDFLGEEELVNEVLDYLLGISVG